MVEHLSPKQPVAGSSPASPAKLKRVDVKKIVGNPKLRAELIRGGVEFLCALEGHKHERGGTMTW